MTRMSVGCSEWALRQPEALDKVQEVRYEVQVTAVINRVFYFALQIACCSPDSEPFPHPVVLCHTIICYKAHFSWRILWPVLMPEPENCLSYCLCYKCSSHCVRPPTNGTNRIVMSWSKCIPSQKKTNTAESLSCISIVCLVSYFCSLPSAVLYFSSMLNFCCLSCAVFLLLVSQFSSIQCCDLSINVQLQSSIPALYSMVMQKNILLGAIQPDLLSHIPGCGKLWSSSLEAVVQSIAAEEKERIMIFYANLYHYVMLI